MPSRASAAFVVLLALPPAAGVWLLQVPVRGSVLDVYLASALLILANLTPGC